MNETESLVDKSDEAQCPDVVVLDERRCVSQGTTVTSRQQCLLIVSLLLLAGVFTLLYHTHGTDIHFATSRSKLLSLLDDDKGGDTNVIDLTISDTSIQTPAGLIQVHANDDTVYTVPKRSDLQIENYRLGTGLMLNLHITHHGGTFVCGSLGHSPDAIGRAPEGACNSEGNMKNRTGYDYKKKPWTRKETARMIPLVRQHFHMIAWEFGYLSHIPHPSLKKTEWENPNLFSILVVRDPISRLLAGDGWVHKHFPNIGQGNASRDEWWEYAKDDWFTNNYALRVLAGKGCCDGAQTDSKYLEKAKALANRFSIVLDIECLSEGIQAVANLVNISIAEKARHSNMKKEHHHAPSRERIGYDDVYDYLVAKNHLDIELYEYAKRRALVNCAKIHER